MSGRVGQEDPIRKGNSDSCALNAFGDYHEFDRDLDFIGPL